MISIIMPVYNEEQYMEETIQSIISQTLHDWELIIVDDASIDATSDLALDYVKKDARIRYIRNEKNLGVAASINIGWEAAKGKYIARADADDPLAPNRLLEQRIFLEKHPQISLVSSETMEDNGSIQQACLDQYHTPDEMKASFLVGNYIPHPAVMFVKADFDKYGYRYDPNYRLEDYELWTRASAHLKFAKLGTILVKHRVRDDSVCGRMGLELREQCKEIIKKYAADVFFICTENYEDAHFYPIMNEFMLLAADACKDKMEYLQSEIALMEELSLSNKKNRIIDQKVLIKVLKIKWNWLVNMLGANDGLLLNTDNMTGIADAVKKQINTLIFNKKQASVPLQCTAGHLNQICSSRSSHKINIIVYGIGKKCYDYIDFRTGEPEHENVNVIAFCDKNASVYTGSIGDKSVLLPEKLALLEYDYICVTSRKFYEEICQELVSVYKVTQSRIITFDDLLKALEMCKKLERLP